MERLLRSAPARAVPSTGGGAEKAAVKAARRAHFAATKTHMTNEEEEAVAAPVQARERPDLPSRPLRNPLVLLHGFNGAGLLGGC